MSLSVRVLNALISVLFLTAVIGCGKPSGVAANGAVQNSIEQNGDALVGKQTGMTAGSITR